MSFNNSTATGQTVDWNSPEMKTVLEQNRPADKTRKIATEKEWLAKATDPSPQVRERLADELGKRRVAAAFPAIALLLEDPVDSVRQKSLAFVESYFSGDFRIVGSTANLRFVWWIRESRIDEKLERVHARTEGKVRERIGDVLNQMKFLIQLSVSPLSYEVGKGSTLKERGRVKITEDPDSRSGALLVIGTIKKKIPESGSITDWSYSPDRKILAVGVAGPTIKIPVDEKGRDISRPDEPLPGQAKGVRIIQSGGIHLYDAQTGQFLGQVELGPVSRVSFHQNGRTILYQEK